MELKGRRQRSNNRQALSKKTIPRLDGTQSGAQTDGRKGNRVKVWQIYSNGSKAWGTLSMRCPLLSRNANLGAESGIAAMVNGLPAKTGFVICMKRLPPRTPRPARRLTRADSCKRRSAPTGVTGRPPPSPYMRRFTDRGVRTPCGSNHAFSAAQQNALVEHSNRGRCGDR